MFVNIQPSKSEKDVAIPERAQGVLFIIIPIVVLGTTPLQKHLFQRVYTSVYILLRCSESFHRTPALQLISLLHQILWPCSVLRVAACASFTVVLAAAQLYRSTLQLDELTGIHSSQRFNSPTRFICRSRTSDLRASTAACDSELLPPECRPSIIYKALEYFFLLGEDLCNHC